MSYLKAKRLIEEAQQYRLRELNLSKLNLEELPKSVCQLNGLERLDISHNQLSELPSFIFDLTGLQELIIGNNRLTYIPGDIGKLKNLRVFHTWANYIQELPVEVLELKKLVNLSFCEGQGQFSHIKKALELFAVLTEMKGLETLELATNGICELPESIGNLKNLKALTIVANHLEYLPESLTNLTRLESLELDDNSIEFLSDEIGNLTNLRRLTLSDNELPEVPDSICELNNLTELGLSYNSIEEIPDKLGNLMLLEKLDLSSNPISSLPISMHKLRNLRDLELSDCDNLPIPQEILEDQLNPKKILDYYFSTIGHKGEELRELKLLVVGRGGAGKTSIIKRLNGEPLDLQESETHGININQLKMECQGEQINVRVWDFGGQHVLHSMHEFFLTARSLYLLVLGERDDMAERDAEYWLQLIRGYAPNAPVIVIINKNRGRMRELDTAYLEKRYGPITAWLPTECASGFEHTIDNLRKVIADAATHIKGLRDKFPAKWRDIKNWLETSDKPYVELQEFKQKCVELGEGDPEEQSLLVKWLNDLGIAINYNEDERLHNTCVLKPDWLANGIYAMLRANDPRHEQSVLPDAILSSDNIGRVLKAAEALEMLLLSDYPQEKWSFLMQLMLSFQLSFKISDHSDAQLIPGLLPLTPPPGCEDFTDENTLRLRWEFNALPASLMPRVMVRLFSLLETDKYWRRGGILGFDQAKGRLWTEQNDKLIYLAVKGNEKSKQELLTMIRSTMESLLKEYRALSATEQIFFKSNWVSVEILKDMGAALPPSINKSIYQRPVQLFISYSHQNKDWFARLKPLLEFHDSNVHVVGHWHDQKLKAGDRWDDEIRQNMETMNVFVCLLSYEYLASEYIRDVELSRALAREKKGEITILPIMLYEMDIQQDCPPLSEFSPLPGWKKCWRDYEKQNGDYRDAHVFIRKGLREVIDKMKV